MYQLINWYLFIYSLEGNNIGIAGAQALAEGLQHCSHLQELKWVIYVFV